MDRYFDQALEASRLAQEIILESYQRHDFSVTIKSDQTPVTEVDIAAETAIYNHLAAAFPDHGFYREESGMEQMDAEFIWLIDPIDGTKAFVRRRPFFSTQIALMHKGEIILGVSRAPAFNGGECAYALKGRGAWLNDERIHVSQTKDLEAAVFSSGNIKSLARDEHGWQRYGALLQKVNTTRGFGDFLHYHFLACGALDLVIESDVSILDVAALSIIVSEAGGKVTDFSGNQLSLESKNIVASNTFLHDTALRFIQK